MYACTFYHGIHDRHKTAVAHDGLGWEGMNNRGITDASC